MTRYLVWVLSTSCLVTIVSACSQGVDDPVIEIDRAEIPEQIGADSTIQDTHAETHKTEQLPSSPEELDRVHSSERRLVFSELPDESKRELWRAHLAAYVECNHDLSHEQNLVLQRAMEVLHEPDLYSRAAGEAGWHDTIGPRLAEIQRDAIEVFGREDAFVMLGHLGSSSTEPSSSVLPNAPTCSCSTADDWCWWGKRCKSWWNGGSFCVRTESGCGTFWAYECDGKCQ